MRRRSRPNRPLHRLQQLQRRRRVEQLQVLLQQLLKWQRRFPNPPALMLLSADLRRGMAMVSGYHA